MKQIVTETIILRRTDYGEADRILTLLTPTEGKVQAIAKGVRKSRSKLAGGVELFSISDISFILGKSEIKTITSTRLKRHFGNIVKELDRSGIGFEMLKVIDKTVKDQPERDYFQLLGDSLALLDNLQNQSVLVALWFYLHLLRLEGHAPNLKTTPQGETLDSGHNFNFDTESMAFTTSKQGRFTPDHIKLLRLLIGHRSAVVERINSSSDLAEDDLQLIRSLQAFHRT